MSCCRERTECSTSGQWGSGGWTNASNMSCLNAAPNRCVLMILCVLYVYLCTCNKHNLEMRLSWLMQHVILFQSQASFLLDNRLLLELELNNKVDFSQLAYSCNFHFDLSLFLNKAVYVRLNDVSWQTFATMTVLKTTIIMWPSKFLLQSITKLTYLILTRQAVLNISATGIFIVKFFYLLEE